MTTTLTALPLAQLRQALALKEQMEALQYELAAILATPAVPASSARASKLERKLSPTPRQGAKQRTGQKPRPAIAKEFGLLGLCNSADLPRPVRAARRKFSAEARTRMAASARVLWGKAK